MNNSNGTYSMDINKLKFIDGDFPKCDDWYEMICEDGSFSNESQYITFDNDGVEVVVYFDLSVVGNISHDPGDYWTPPYTDVDYTEVEVSIKSLQVDECDVELTEGLKDLLEVEIKKYL